MKVNISINDDLLKQVDEFAERNYSNRSAVISNAVQSYMLQASIPYYLGQIAVTMKTISENNAIDDDSKKKLAEFEQLSRLLVGAK